MRKYWTYFWHIARHKWHIFWKCWQLGIFWRGVTHDLSKFRPSEFFPYARWFHGKPILVPRDEFPDDAPGDVIFTTLRDGVDGSRIYPFEHQEVKLYIRGGREHSLICCTEKVRLDFVKATTLHYRRNVHHYEHWHPPSEMPHNCVKEMVADWHDPNLPMPTLDFYLARRPNIEVIMGPGKVTLIDSLMEPWPWFWEPEGRGWSAFHYCRLAYWSLHGWAIFPKKAEWEVIAVGKGSPNVGYQTNIVFIDADRRLLGRFRRWIRGLTDKENTTD